LASLGLKVAVSVCAPSVVNVSVAAQDLLPALPVDSVQVPSVPSTLLLNVTEP
jgi:hypothetical protein